MKNQISILLKLIAVVLVSSFLFTQAKAQTGCAANWSSLDSSCTVFFTNTSTGTNSNTEYWWTFGDGKYSSLQNPSHTYSVSGTYNVCLILYSSDSTCYSTLCQNVTVTCPSPPCTANWNSQSGTNSCTVYFTNASTGTTNNTYYYWSFGDSNYGNSSQQNPVHTYSASGTYTVCLTITDSSTSCNNSFCKNVTVTCSSGGLCQANWQSYPDTGSICQINFYNTSTGANANAFYFWTFGNGQTSSLQNPAHTYSAPGTYTVCLYMYSDSTCADTICKNITVQCGTTGIASSSQIDLSLSVNNPVFSSADIYYSIPSAGNVKLVLFDLIGNKVGVLESGNKNAGMHSYTLNTGCLSKGIYFLHFIFERTTITKKIIIVR